MQQFGMFAKYWEPGRVKTRLASRTGKIAASQVYRSFITTMVHRFSNIATTRVIAFTPPEHESDFAKIADENWQLVPQANGDLGQRMQAYFEQSLSRGASRVVLVGSDSPSLPREIVTQAFHLLETATVVLGPSSDGGYYLVGASKDVPPIFDGIDWSSKRVWQQTVTCLKRNNVDFAELPKWYDVDDLDDLRQLNEELTQLKRSDHSWYELAEIVSQTLAAVGDRCTIA